VKRLLITGGSGDLGRRLSQRAVAAGYDVHVTYLSRLERILAGQPHQLDLCDQTAVQTALASIHPDAIIHTALGGVPDPERQLVSAGLNLHELRDPGVRLILLSSDMVFDGRRPPYREDAAPTPLSAYGRAKAQLEAFGDCAVRTSLIYDFEPGNKQVDWLLSTIARGERCPLFDDEFRNPIWSVNLADALLELAESDFKGVLHVAGPESMSRYEFGCKMLQTLGLNPADHVTRTSQAGTGRPPDLTFALGKARHILHTPLLTFAEALAAHARP
jgi:dTDP-4-dehydrorhamnose reductase